MTLVRPTLSALIERARSDIETRLPGADSRLRHSVLDVLARTMAGAAAGIGGVARAAGGAATNAARHGSGRAATRISPQDKR